MFSDISFKSVGWINSSVAAGSFGKIVLRFARNCQIFTKLGLILGPKINLKKCMFSDHSRVKLEISNRKMSEKYSKYLEST